MSEDSAPEERKREHRTPGTGGVIDLWKRKDGTPTKAAERGDTRWRGWYVNLYGKVETHTSPLRREAQAWVDDKVQAVRVDGGTVKVEGDTPLRVFWDAIRSETDSKAAGSAKLASAWGYRVEPVWGDMPVARITEPVVRRWVKKLRDGGTSAATVTAALEVMRPALDRAVKAHAISANPARGIKVRPDPQPRRSYLTIREVETLAGTMTRPGDATLVRVLAYTGLRFGEAAALEVRDFQPPRLYATRGISEVAGKLHEDTLKTHEQRHVQLPLGIVPEVEALCRGRAQDARIFPAPRGGTLRINTWRRRQWTPALEAAQAEVEKVRQAEALEADDGEPTTRPLPTLTPHDLRHTAASLSVQAGAHVKAVQKLLGHKSATTTLDRYADLFDSDLVDVAARLDEARDAALFSGSLAGSDETEPEE